MPAEDRGAEIVLIRHAPATTGGRLCGRTDVPADLPGAAELAAVRAAAGAVDRVIASPALRCRQTAAALWPGDAQTDARLWEQDFGAWDGLALAEVPDIGTLGAAALAAHVPPGGESFAEVVARVGPVLAALQGRVALVVHAGVVRAALALAVGAPQALAFEVAPLSVTRLRRTGATWAVRATNWRPA